MAGMDPLVVENLVKRYGRSGEVTALRDVNLNVRPHSFAAVMGASGSGKSTLLHLMAGLTAPDAGRVLVNGQDLAQLSDASLTRFRRDHIGLVFQGFNLIPTLSATENIALPLRLRGARESEWRPRVEALIERVGLTSRRDHRPDALSGGEQQRVAIARALSTGPSVILADEPTGNLDSVAGESVCRLLRELNETEHATIVMVTHEPSVAMHAKTVVVIRDGQVENQFNTADVADAVALAARYHALASGAGN